MLSHTHTQAAAVGPEDLSLLAADMESPAAPTGINTAFLSAFTSTAGMTGTQTQFKLTKSFHNKESECDMQETPESHIKVYLLLYRAE